MSDERGHLEQNEPIVYQIRIRGALDASWSDWFAGLTVCPQAGGDTLLTGPVRDQSALHGLLAKIRDLGLPLLSVNRVGLNPSTRPDSGRTPA
jgi:hypothetical protein